MMQLNQSLHSASADVVVPVFPSMVCRDEQIRETVEKIVKRACHDALAERRGEMRYPFRDLVRITPVLRDGTLSSNQSLVVVGKHISQGGFGFFHRDPMPYRRIVVEFDQESGPPIALLMQLFWCRFLRDGWYDSGGKFDRVVSIPADENAPENVLGNFSS